MTKKDIITGSAIIINVRNNASDYEIRQEIIRESAKAWRNRIEGKKIDKMTLLHDIRIFEKWALKYGLQRELREKGII